MRSRFRDTLVLSDKSYLSLEESRQDEHIILGKTSKILKVGPGVHTGHLVLEIRPVPCT